MLEGPWGTADILEDLRDRAWALDSLSGLLKGNDDLDKIKPVCLEIQAYILQQCLQLLKAIEKNEKFLKGFKNLS